MVSLECCVFQQMCDYWGESFAFCIDLRWNNIGLLGGRALLNCLHSNKTLKRLELAGNNVPSDILKAVGKYYLLHRKESVTPFPFQHLRGIGHLLLQKGATPPPLPFSTVFTQCPTSLPLVF